MRNSPLLLGLIAFVPAFAPLPENTRGLASAPEGRASAETFRDFDVVIAGGTTAAFAAAVSSAESGARTALIEPTDWVGGQLTASGVPAVDEAWHKITDPRTKQVLNVSAIARKPQNMTPNFRAMLDATGNPGGGWVSNYCFQPRDFLDQHLLPLEMKLKDRLVVFRDTVIKSVEADPKTGSIKSITAIKRTPRPGVAWNGYDRRLSEDLADWYSPAESPRFQKTSLTFVADPRPGHETIFLDATEWGEVLVLAEAPYLQGVEDVDGGREGNDTCGQATVIDIVERLHAQPTEEPPGPVGVDKLGFGNYKKFPDAWDRIWTYRRIRGKGSKAAVGDICLQNWGYSGRDNEGGNDYPFGYLFKSKAETAAERADWKGGIDLKVLAAAEQRALAWHYWFKANVPAPFVPEQVTLDRGVLGTGTGLAKMPYIRDTRRSIGLDGFILKVDDLGGDPSKLTGKRFRDRVALGAYPADIHPVLTCEFPRYVYSGHETLPFCIPFRALTNERYGNLLVAGKTMAQSFLANAATRLHPIEWSTGTAAGVSAAAMSKNGWNARQALEHIAELQALIKEKTPIDWSINGETYPKSGEETPF
jgi:FAD dependent oxidoreductase